MPSRTKISTAEFVQDMRNGLTSSELIYKYSLRPRELDGVLAQLRKAIADPAELYGRAAANGTNGTRTKFRFLRRHKIELSVLVYDANDPTIHGDVRDISETGIRVQNMETKPDDIKNLIVLANEYFSIDPFKFQAQCRWTSPSDEESDMLAGFEIIEISEESLKSLARFIETYANVPRGSEAKSAASVSRKPASREPRKERVWVCPFCEMPQPNEFEECPQSPNICSSSSPKEAKLQTRLRNNRGPRYRRFLNKTQSMKKQLLFPPIPGKNLNLSREALTSILTMLYLHTYSGRKQVSTQNEPVV